MHPNPAFHADNPALAALLVQQIGFGTVFASTPDGPRVAHTPFLIDDAAGELRFHLARGNALTRYLDGASALACVTGPDAYISPSDYGDEDQVPTWNYVAVELEGPVQRLDRDALAAMVDELSALHEARIGIDPPWTSAKLEPAYRSRLLDGVTGFALRVTARRTTLKLGQNKDAALRANVMAALRARGQGATAHLMDNLVGAGAPAAKGGGQ